MSKVKRIINLANRDKNQVYNILTFPTHERYETQLAKTGHNFYALNITDGKKWNDSQTPIPNNYYILPENDICDYINYDFILVQSRYWQYSVAAQINQRLQLPMIVLEHTLPPETSESQLNHLRSMLGNINIFISEFSQKSWNIHENSIVIHHGIDSGLFAPKDIVKEKYARL